MSNVRTDFVSLIPRKELPRLVGLGVSLPVELVRGISVKEVDDAALAAYKELIALDKKRFSSAELFGGTKAYYSYVKKEPLSETDVRTNLQQKAEAKGVQLTSQHLDELITALKSSAQLPEDINAFLHFINT